jgi:amino acid transporter
MNKHFLSILLFLIVGLLSCSVAEAQCSICTKTASQLGEKPAAALNTAIIYLMLAPFAIIGFIGWRWWKNNKNSENNTQ